MIAIRGAVRVARNDRDAIYRETQRLLAEIMARNGIERRQIVSAFFTMTPDLNADFPAYAARSLGWADVPMLGAQETPVPGALDRMVRVLLHVDAPGPARHVYLGDAAAMRPDLAEPEEEPSPPPDRAEFGPILVCGLGLIGGSVALGLRRSGRFAEVLGQDPDSRARERARASGAVTSVAESPEELLERAETIVLAMPVPEILAWLEREGRNLRRGVVVTDTGSTKAGIVAAMEGLPEGVEAVGGHPMAGSERSGIDAARPDLFHGSVWALVDTGRTGRRARDRALAVVETLEARPLFVSAEEHDRAVALTSHLPYLVAAALARHVAGRADGAARGLAGPGLRDMTRLAASEPSLMGGILATNRPHVGEALAAFRGELDAFAATLERALENPDIAGAAEDLSARLRACRRARETLLGP